MINKLLGLIDIWGGIAIITIAIIARYNAWVQERAEERKRDEMREAERYVEEYITMNEIRMGHGLKAIVNMKTGHVEIMENPTKSIDPPELPTKR